MRLLAAVGAAALFFFSSCSTSKPTPEQAKTFADEAEQKLMTLGIEAGRADWVKSTYIIAAKLNERAIAATVDYVKQSAKFDGLALDPVTARKLKLLKFSLTIAT